MNIGFQYCQYAPWSIIQRSILTTEIQNHTHDIISACQYDNVNITPIASGQWKYAALWPHFVALGPPDAHLGPRALLYLPRAASGGPLATKCLALGQHIFQYPSAMGMILYHDESDNVIILLFRKEAEGRPSVV